MRKLVESTFVTLDGVISSPEKWGPPYWNDEHSDYALTLLKQTDALLLGRKTYEGFATAWPRMSGDEYADRINAMPKYVASRTLTQAEWNSTILSGDVAEQVAALKNEPGADILKFGTGELDKTLLERRLLDELHLWVFPYIAGTGERILDGTEAGHLTLLGTTTFSTGLVVHRYAPKL